MAIISSGSFAKALYPGVNKWYGRAYEDYAPEWTDLFEQSKSTRAYEEDVGTSGFGLAAVKPEGSSISYDEESQAFLTRYNHTVYALGFIITREMVEDDLYDLVGKRRATALARSMRHTKETNGANIYNRAFNSTYTGGDGLELISNAHVNYAGGTWSNRPTTYTDLSEASLEQACIDIAKWTDDRGLKIAVRPECLILPVDLKYEAERILSSPYRVSTADNDVNAIMKMGSIPKVVINHRLTDTDAWFIRTDAPDGMKAISRRGMSFDIDNDFDTENAKFKASERYSFGWTDPRGLYGSEGA